MFVVEIGSFLSSLPSLASDICSVCTRPLSTNSIKPRPQYKRYTFMHNGGIPGFGRMKRQLLALLGDEAYQTIEGTTDSEVRTRRSS